MSSNPGFGGIIIVVIIIIVIILLLLIIILLFLLLLLVLLLLLLLGLWFGVEADGSLRKRGLAERTQHAAAVGRLVLRQISAR